MSVIGDDGFVSNRVRSLPPSLIRNMYSRRRPTSIDLSLGEPALTADPELLDRALFVLRSGPQGYTDTAGLLPLRDAIARHHGLPGRDQAENAIVTVGSEEAVYLAMMSTVDPGDVVLIPEPGYPAYVGIAGLIGASAERYEIAAATGLVARAADIEPRLERIRESGRRARMLVLNGPSNPFGSVDEADELERIARVAERHGLVVLSDEIYRDLTYTGAPPPSICEMTPSSIFVSGLSKSCAFTGLRIGYLIGSAKLVKQATLAHQLVCTCAARLSQLAAIEVFKEPARLRAHVPYYERAREAVRAAAAMLPEDAPLLLGRGAFYAILDVSKYAGGDPMALAIELLEKEDVVVVPGIAFGASGTWFWRISYAAGAEKAGEGVRRIARFLRAKRSGSPG